MCDDPRLGKSSDEAYHPDDRKPDGARFAYGQTFDEIRAVAAGGGAERCGGAAMQQRMFRCRGSPASSRSRSNRSSVSRDSLSVPRMVILFAGQSTWMISKSDGRDSTRSDFQYTSMTAWWGRGDLRTAWFFVRSGLSLVCL